MNSCQCDGNFIIISDTFFMIVQSFNSKCSPRITLRNNIKTSQNRGPIGTSKFMTMSPTNDKEGSMEVKRHTHECKPSLGKRYFLQLLSLSLESKQSNAHPNTF
jgi:hypothetical protein